MKIVSAKCPSCGANIEVDENSNQTKCEFCHSTIIVEDAIKKYKVEISGTVSLKDAEKIGYEMEKGKIKAQKEEKKRLMEEKKEEDLRLLEVERQELLKQIKENDEESQIGSIDEIYIGMEKMRKTKFRKVLSIILSITAIIIFILTWVYMIIKRNNLNNELIAFCLVFSIVLYGISRIIKMICEDEFERYSSIWEMFEDSKIVKYDDSVLTTEFILKELELEGKLPEEKGIILSKEINYSAKGLAILVENVKTIVTKRIETNNQDVSRIKRRLQLLEIEPQIISYKLEQIDTLGDGISALQYIVQVIHRTQKLFINCSYGYFPQIKDK